MNDKELLFTVIRSCLHGSTIPQEQKLLITERIKEIYELAVPQGLSLMLAQALSDQGLLGEDEISQVLRKSTMVAFARQTQQDFAYSQICECLTDCEIPFVPLKGAVIRKYYPQSWMRTSCDIDILVKEADLDKAISALKEKLGYDQPADREYHDVALHSSQGVLLELHFSLKENNDKLDKVLSQVWDYVQGDENSTGLLSLREYFFVFHVVAHCAYHFMSSGCGAKPLLDLWILRHRMGYDEEKVVQLCRMSGLESFYEKIMKLAECWFTDATPEPMTERLETYILDAGFGGSLDNAVAADVLKKGGRKNFIAGRIFLPYDMLKEYYPVLNEHRWLMPVCQVRRWFAGLRRNRLGVVVESINKGCSVSDARLEEVKDLFNELNLLDS